MTEEKAYLIKIERTQEVEVVATSTREAQMFVKAMYLSGDACADLEDATFGCIGIEDLPDD